jgi:tripartite ATP-independent transporter DctM subunit
MGIIGFIGVAAFVGLNPTASVISTEISGFLTNNNVAVLPLFLMMGSFATVAGIADDAYALAYSLLSRFRGGLAMATIAGCAGFGAVTGSSVATAATIGRVALPQMLSRGYSPALSTGSIAAGGTLGNLVPPGSGPLVLFALLTEASIGQLFVASVIPAVLVVLAYLITVWVFVRFHADAAPVAVKLPPGEFTRALRGSGPLMVLFLGTLGGMYFGIVTATEAAAAGAVGAFLIAVARGKLRADKFWSVMAEVTQVTAMIYMLIFGALAFAYFCELTGIAAKATTFISTLNWPPLLLIGIILFTFIGLGTFMDSYAVMIITIPIITPLVLAAGYDIVWWGIINLFVIEIGAISPPFGLNMFVLKTIGDVPLKSIFYGSAWFCVAAIITLIVLALFPGLSLWLPSTMSPA